MSYPSGYQANPYYPNGGGSSGGGGGFVPSGSQSSPGPKKNTNPALRPVTIRMIQKAEAGHQDKEFTIDGSDVQNIKLVAEVLRVEVTDTNRRYNLEDSTGEVEARLWSEASNPGADVEEITEGCTVCLIGTLRVFNNKRSLNCAHIRKVTDQHETYYHMLEVIQTTLILKHGLPASMQIANAPSAAPGGSAYAPSAGASTGTQGAPAMSQHFTNLKEPHRLICNFLAAHPGRGTSGVQLKHIVTGIRSQTTSNSADIAAALDELIEQGIIYNTADEETYDLVE